MGFRFKSPFAMIPLAVPSSIFASAASRRLPVLHFVELQKFGWRLKAGSGASLALSLCWPPLLS